MRLTGARIVAAGMAAAALAVPGSAGLGAPPPGTGDHAEDRLVLPAEPEIRLEESPWDGHPCSIRVSGLPADALAGLRAADPDEATWRELLSVYTGEPADRADDHPAMLGRYVVVEDSLRFVPRFPWVPGLTYHARFDGTAFDAVSGRSGTGTPRLLETFSLPESEQPRARVEAIYPSADILPQNLLRLYVIFSAPMLPKEVSRHVRLVDEAGDTVDVAFVDIDQGLWDPTRRRLTLFLHPGRIKRGVGPHETLGPPLVEGRTYRLVIDGGMLDAAGRPLAAQHVKRFRAGAPDRTSPDAASWRVSGPRAGGRAPLVVDLGEALDHALVGRLIRVEDGSGEPLAGEVHVAPGERRWEFVPESPWESGDYTIRVDPALEDPAGNNMSRRFEEASSTPAAETVAIALHVVVP